MRCRTGIAATGRLCDLAMDLDAEKNVARCGVVCEFMDVAHEGFFVFALAVVAADGGVHDLDAHALTEIDCLETILQSVLGGQVGMAAEA